jgi:hypothetical protein
MKKRLRLKCSKRVFCTRLEERLNPEANHGKGLALFYVTHHKSGKGRRLGVMHKTSEKDGGLLLTFCPWCGTNLLELFKLVRTSGNMPEVDPGAER